MNTYEAGKDPLDGPVDDNRDWVFGMLDHPRYRDRLEVLAGLELTRRPGCEPCLRALITDDWSYEALYHLGWCESCRSASFALGMDAAAPQAASSPHRRHALYVVLAAGVAIAAPLAFSQLLSDNGPVASSDGPKHVVTTTPSTTPGTTPGTTPTTTPGTTPGTTPTTTPTTTVPTTPSTTPTVPPVKPVPRAKPDHPSRTSGHRALPKTT